VINFTADKNFVLVDKGHKSLGGKKQGQNRDPSITIIYTIHGIYFHGLDTVFIIQV
jgi:hypothetical protein